MAYSRHHHGSPRHPSTKTRPETLLRLSWRRRLVLGRQLRLILRLILRLLIQLHLLIQGLHQPPCLLLGISREVFHNAFQQAVHLLQHNGRDYFSKFLLADVGITPLNLLQNSRCPSLSHLLLDAAFEIHVDLSQGLCHAVLLDIALRSLHLPHGTLHHLYVPGSLCCHGPKKKTAQGHRVQGAIKPSETS